MLNWVGHGGWKPPPRSIHHFGIDYLAFGLLRLVGGGFGGWLDVGVLLGAGADILGGFGEGLEGTFEIADGTVDGVNVVAADGVFHGLDLAGEEFLEFGGGVVAEFTELFFDVKDEVVGLVLGIDFFNALLVFFGVGLGVALGLFDLVLGQAGGALDGDFLFLAGLFE